MLKRLLPLLLLGSPLAAQTIFLQPDTTTMGSPQTLTVYDGTTKTFTARVEGVNNKGVNWTTTGGTLIGNVNCTADGPCRVGLYSATNGTFTVTATSAANPSVSASQAIQFNGSPTKVACSAGAPDTSSCHPRFLITPSMVAALQAKATAGNPMYQSRLANAIINFNNDNTIWSWSCNSGTGLPSSDQSGNLPEAHARIYAQMAVLDPSDATYNWKCYGRDTWVYAENAVRKGQINFIGGNEWSQQSEDWAYTQDLLEYTGYLSPSDMSLYRAFAQLEAFQLGENSNGGGTPIPTSLNTTTQFTTGPGQRALGNNYTQSKMLLYTALALTLDDNTTDDPLVATGTILNLQIATAGTSYTVGDTFHVGGGGGVGHIDAVSSGVPTAISITTASTGYNNVSNPVSTSAISGTGTGLTVNVFAGNTCGAARGGMCSDYTGGDLHSQWNFFTGAWLQKWWGHADDPTVVYNALHNFYGNTAFPTGALPTYSWAITGQTYPALGDGVGGETVEGGYWWHVYTMIQAMAAMNSAGWDDPLLYGPQISMEYSSFWDEEMVSQQAAWAFFGSNGQPAEPGYSLRATGGDTEIVGYVTNPSYQMWAAAMLDLDQLEGRTDRASAEEWTVLNAAFGGPAGTAGGCTSHCGYVSELANSFAASTAWPMMLALPAADPTVSPPADPRSVYPTDIYNDSFNNHQSVRNCWTSSCARVDIYDANTLVDHEHNEQGSYEVIQNGEHITKPRNEFDNYNNVMSRPVFVNGASYTDLTATQSVFCNQSTTYAAGYFGGQFEEGVQKGMTVPLHSEMPNYVANHVDDTLAYTGCDYSGAWNYNDVSAASRDIIWLRGANQIAVYDRGATGTSATKSTSVISTGAVTVSTNKASWLTQSGTQKANVTALLGGNPTFAKLINYVVISAPHSTLQTGTTMQAVCTAHYADGTSADVSSDPNTYWFTDGSPIAISSSGLISTVGGVGTGADAQCINNGAPNLTWNNGLYSIGFVTVGSSSSGSLTGSANDEQGPDWEPQDVVTISAGSTAAAHLFYTLEWGSNTFTPTTATLVQSSAGQGYDCALLATSQICFMHTLATFTGTTYAASGATTQYVSDLAPNTTYNISGTGAPTTGTSDNAGVLTFSAAGTGNITVGAFIPPSIAAVSGGVLSGGTTQ